MAFATLEHARRLTSGIVDALHPQMVVLFGAVAREQRGNDVDLLIVVDDADPGRSAESEAKLRRLVAEHSKVAAVDPFLLEAGVFKSRFQAGSPFLRTIVREGRRLYMRDAERQWLEEAREELAAARYLAGGHYHKAACYHAQQAVEKCLKGRLLGRGWELEKLNSIARLSSLCAEQGISVSLAEQDTAFVDAIYRGRCPGEGGLLPLGEPVAADCERAIGIAESVLGSPGTS